MFMQRILIASIGLLLTLGAYAQQPTPTQQERVQEIMELLQSNPEVIDGLYDSLLLYVAEKEAGGSLGASEQEWLIDNPAHPWLGAEQPQLPISNFTDNNSPFCKRLESVLEQVRAEYHRCRSSILIYPCANNGPRAWTQTRLSMRCKYGAPRRRSTLKCTPV